MILTLEGQGFTAEMVQDLKNAWAGTAKLGPAMRAQLAGAAQTKMQAYQNQWNGEQLDGVALARSLGMNPGQVVPKSSDMKPLDMSTISKTTVGAPATPAAAQPRGGVSMGPPAVGAGAPGQAAPSGGGLPSPKSKEEYDALPPGQYIDPTGQIRTKR
jgi:hypothetical protein